MDSKVIVAILVIFSLNPLVVQFSIKIKTFPWWEVNDHPCCMHLVRVWPWCGVVHDGLMLFFNFLPAGCPKPSRKAGVFNWNWISLAFFMAAMGGLDDIYLSWSTASPCSVVYAYPSVTKYEVQLLWNRGELQLLKKKFPLSRGLIRNEI